MYESEDSQKVINHFLTSDNHHPGTLDYVACHGLLTAVATRDDTFDFDEILKLILDGEPDFQSEDEKQRIHSG